jgi:hypothetical protein
MAGEQIAQDLRIDTSMRQSHVEASPSAPVRGLEAQMDRRRGGPVRGEDGVGELEESVGSVVEAFVKRVAEAVESIGWFHDALAECFPHSLPASGVRTQAKRPSGTYLPIPLPADSGYQAGSGEHHPCGDGSNDDPGQDVEGEMDAEIDTGENDEDPGQHQRGSERRV